MKIEHFVARSVDPKRMYDWDNLLGVCNGVLSGGPAGIVHICDTARGNLPLHIHPAESRPSPEAVFGFDGLGKIAPVGPEAEADCRTLNLNCTRLTDERRAVVADLRSKLRVDDSAKAIQRLLKTASTPTRNGLPPYARVAVEYLRKKLQTR